MNLQLFAGSKSNAMETDILTWMLSGAAVTRPAAWYVALFTDAPGLGVDQPTAEAAVGNCPGYARQQVATWTIAGNQAKNAVAATFTASGPWVAVNYFAVYDASANGRLLFWGDIPQKTLANTDQLKFDVNQITYTEE